MSIRNTYRLILFSRPRHFYHHPYSFLRPTHSSLSIYHPHPCLTLPSVRLLFHRLAHLCHWWSESFTTCSRFVDGHISLHFSHMTFSTLLFTFSVLVFRLRHFFGYTWPLVFCYNLWLSDLMQKSTPCLELFQFSAVPSPQ